MSELTHFDESGASRMVDVGDKEITQRVAVAEAVVTMQPATLELIRGGGMDTVSYTHLRAHETDS